jgi:F-type H+-transporting ATPase subunit b
MASHIEASSNFLLPNWTFVAELVAFLLILAFLWRYVLPPVQKMMREREEMIRKQVEDADAAKEKLAEAQKAYQDALTEARTKAAEIREGARSEAQRTLDELRASAQEQSARIVARGSEQLELQRGAIVRELRAEIGALAVDLSEKIINQRLSDDAQVSATVDAFLAELRQRDDAAAQSVSTETSAGSRT